MQAARGLLARAGRGGRVAAAVTLPCDHGEEAKQAAAVAALREASQRCAELEIPQSEILAGAGFGEVMKDQFRENAKKVVPNLVEKFQEELEASVESQEVGSVSDGPPPSCEERVEAAPLTASNLLESLKERAAEGNLLAQAKMLREAREDEWSMADVLKLLNSGLEQDREEMQSRFREELKRMRGKVTK